eukprot:Skav226486  [mRNA]  locus=scaffold744:34951:36134:- [translate_table: standard]
MARAAPRHSAGDLPHAFGVKAEPAELWSRLKPLSSSKRQLAAVGWCHDLRFCDNRLQMDTWIDETGEKKRSNAGRAAGVYSRVRIEWQEDTALDIERACRAFTLPEFKGLCLVRHGTHGKLRCAVSEGDKSQIL